MAFPITEFGSCREKKGYRKKKPLVRSEEVEARDLLDCRAIFDPTRADFV